MTSIIKVDTIQKQDGSAFPLGGVSQVVQGTLGSTLTASPTNGNNNFSDTGLSASITPSSSSNKILITYTLHAGTNSYQVKSRIMRDSTPVGQGTSEGSRGIASSVVNNYDDVQSTNQYRYSPQGITFLDTPATTSAITYKIQVGTYSTNPFYVNRSLYFQAGTTEGYDAIPLSVITLMEISE